MATAKRRTIKQAQMSPMNMKRHAIRAAEVLKQVSDPTRLQVVLLLNEYGERNVGELCDDLKTQSQPAVSHHLALLRHGGMVQPRRDGKNNYYGLTDAGRELAEVVAGLIDG